MRPPADYDLKMDKPWLGRRRMLELGAGLLGVTALASCTPAAKRTAPDPTEETAGRPATLASAEPSALTVAPRTGVEVTSGSFISDFRPGTATEWSLAEPAPAGYAGQLPVAVFLHGTDSSNRFIFDILGAQSVLQRHLVDGGPAFAIASVDGDDSWWHPRSDGTDTQSMLLREFIPLLASKGFDTGRLALFGLSMGGFGTLLLASKGIVPGLRCVAAISPAVWSEYDAAADGAFDSPQDFEANDVFALRPQLEDLPKRIDCGTDDDLLATVQSYISGLPGTAEGGFQPGGHEDTYWRMVLPDVVSFLGRNLA
jgi:S-formylglutathione hydrolase FrmB